MNSRRGFLAAMVALGLAPLVGQASKIPTDAFGDHFKAIEGEGLWVEAVYLNGRPINDVCLEFNRRDGWAKCYQTKAGSDPNPTQLDENLPPLIRRGKITVKFKDRL